MSLALRMEQLEKEFRDSRVKTKPMDHGKNSRAPYDGKDIGRGNDRHRGNDRPRDNNGRGDYKPRGNDKQNDYQGRQGQRDRARPPAPPQDQGVMAALCWECRQPGHYARECPQRQQRPGGHDRRPPPAGRVYVALPGADDVR
ncbi:hypothetical protein FRX31_014275, partial [Thalictrum thalictroides]